ncbi:ATP-binding protein [Novosphingobium beihaiensis]|uniref:histidine kinase n=1 Tax=Novosphingobium beihaiensis TaxID=2930389 RepID=A0ABT0BSU9_9SPHN|nr:ATP-binding protein [Novosphingobium beihaiensis]MCJ2188122.1 ATP-binding protein [Novosphingobium beihaiensis]
MIRSAVSGKAQQAEQWRQRFAKIVAFVAPLMIGAVVILLTQQVRTTDHLGQEKEAAQEQRAQLFLLMSAHQDVETGGRGYVITGDASFLEPYDEGRRQLMAIWPSLSEYASVRPREQALVRELRMLSNRKLAYTRGTIGRRRSGDMQGAEARVRSGRGKALMDQIRDRIGQLVQLQQATIAERTANAEAAVTNLRILTFALLAALAALLAAAWLALQNSMRARDRVLAEQEDLALRQKAILESAMDGIVTIEPGGAIEAVNAATLRMFGYDPGELDSRDFGILLADQPPIGQIAEELSELGLEDDPEGVTLEIAARRSGGSEFPMEMAISVAVLNEGLRYVAVIRDITERKRVEQLKSDFVSTVTHELRTPLTSIAGALGLLEGGGGGPLNERASRLITIAHSNADRLVRLINDILDIEKIESGNMPFNLRELDLTAAVRASVEENRSYAAKFGAHISLSAPMTPMVVSADRDRLAQVFTNLLSNAAKYSPPDGTVQVTIGPHGGFHRVTIADEGPGIPEDFQDQIFSKFAQADSSSSRAKGGTGLGLSIVREIVTRLGGEVSFDTKPGQGTRFHIDLPAVEPRRPPRNKARKDPPLLVCGGDAAQPLAAALREAGHAVTVAEARAPAHDAMAAARYAGIVVDLGLPDSAGIIRMVREDKNNADTPILAFGSEPGAAGPGGAVLILDWLEMPVDVSRLANCVQAAGLATGHGKPRILHVEADPGVQKMAAEALDEYADIAAAGSTETARALFDSEDFDCVILSLSLESSDGAELLPHLQRSGDLPVPVIILSPEGPDSESAGLANTCLARVHTSLEELAVIAGMLTEVRRKRMPAL